jgi:hypothetical protein
MQNNDHARQQAASVLGMGYNGEFRDRLRVNREAAVQVYGQIKDYIVRNGYLPGKYLRPWELDRQLYERLNRKEPWWGFEFETGYKSHEDRAAVINHVWDSWDNVVFDSEGEGRAAVEITFAPQEMSKYLNGTADAFKFVEYLTGNQRVQNNGNANVGTHINFSHPLLTGANIGNVCIGLARSIAALPMKQGGNDTRMFMFGRSKLYGGFFEQAVGTSVWLEGKLFRTTYDIATFKRYLKVCEGLTKCMGVLCEQPTKMVDRRTHVAYVTNLYDVCFSGAKPVVDWAKSVYIDGVRGNDLLNGPLAQDNAKAITNAELAGIAEEDEEEDDDYEDEDYEDEDDAGIWCEECQDYH